MPRMNVKPDLDGPSLTPAGEQKRRRRYRRTAEPAEPTEPQPDSPEVRSGLPTPPPPPIRSPADLKDEEPSVPTEAAPPATPPPSPPAPVAESPPAAEPAGETPPEEPPKPAGKKAVMLVELGFDVREKDKNAAATQQVIGVFLQEETSLPTARIVEFLNKHKDSIKYYAGWDGQIYPKFVLAPTIVF